MGIPVRSESDLAAMGRAGHVVALCHQAVEAAVRPGVTTGELDTIVRDVILANGATSNFLGHLGFTGTICASVNDQILHGIPGPLALEEGDIVTIDTGAIVDGFHGDSAWTYAVGMVSEEALRLLADTEAVLLAGLTEATAGNRLGDVSHAIEKCARARGRGIVREYGGHGIGQEMWEEPHVPNYGRAGRGPLLRTGMTLAIEPMLTLGAEAILTLEDGWTVVTRDSSLAAHFEHTIVITDGAPHVLTKRLPKVVH